MADINLGVGGANSAVAGGYDIDNSCKFEDDNDEWLYRTNASGTNRKTWTVSWWFKQTELRSVNGAATEHWRGGAYGEGTRAGIFADDRIWIDIGGGDGNTGTRFRSLSTQKIRDTSAWYHIVIACDSTQSTEADRLKVWLNGVEVTAWDQRQYPTLNYQSALQGTGGVQMKWGSADATYHGYSGYLAECNYLDGVTATQNDFGEFDEDSGIWKPKEYTGSYGTNGSYLDFKIASDLGANAKGNDVNFSLNNITAADQATDTPTNNFCTLNPLGEKTGSAAITEGATKIDNSGTASWETAYSSIGVTSGKWYAEVTPQLGSFNTVFGIVNFDTAIHDGSTYNNAGYWLGNFDSGSSIYYYFNGSGAGSIVVNVTAGVVIGLALDLDNNTLDFYVNGSQNKQATSLPSGTYGFIADVQGTGGPYIQCNFGGYTAGTISSAASDANGYGTFEYAPPSGYYALCTKNLAEYG